MNPEPIANNTSLVNNFEAVVRAYHERTKHKFTAYAQGPETLDWDAQPAPFRHFNNTAKIQLPDFNKSLKDPALISCHKKTIRQTR